MKCAPSFFLSHTHIRITCKFYLFFLQGLQPDCLSLFPLLLPWSKCLLSLAETTADGHHLNKVSHFPSLLCSNPPLTAIPLGAEPAPSGLWGWHRLAPSYPASPCPSPESPPSGLTAGISSGHSHSSLLHLIRTSSWGLLRPLHFNHKPPLMPLLSCSDLFTAQTSI